MQKGMTRMLCDSYMLDSQALALTGYSDDLGNRSMILTMHGTYISRQAPVELLKQACLAGGSAKTARKREAAAILKSRQKLPFILTDGIGVFPTSSSRHSTCVWVFNHFFTPSFLEKKKTVLTFSSGLSIEAPASIHTIHQQAGRLHMLLLRAEEERLEANLRRLPHPPGRFLR
ncbi:competence protein ComK [Sporosarcina koreensis]|uniref:competence protein ComK n=1 Tax=Sporosarcina koreensis TaxID=334735 RepID=UPI0009E22C68|nr:competence protein ComK [Sporosarcina koreensis]